MLRAKKSSYIATSQIKVAVAIQFVVAVTVAVVKLYVAEVAAVVLQL